MMTSLSVPLSKITEVPSVKESEPMWESELKCKDFSIKNANFFKNIGIEVSNDPSIIPQLEEFLAIQNMRNKNAPV